MLVAGLGLMEAASLIPEQIEDVRHSRGNDQFDEQAQLGVVLKC